LCPDPDPNSCFILEHGLGVRLTKLAGPPRGVSRLQYWCMAFAGSMVGVCRVRRLADGYVSCCFTLPAGEAPLSRYYYLII
jgi:hypothetical protein